MSKLHSFLADSMRTRYTIDLPDQSSCAFTFGSPSAALDRVLRAYHASTFGYMTAYNPESTTLAPELNQQRHQALCREIERRGFGYLTGRAIPEGNLWEPEVCVLALNMSRDTVREICLAYAQDAAVVGDWGSPPKLLFTNPALRDDFLTLIQNCVLD